MLYAFGIFSGILALTGLIPYIRDTIKGNTKPNRVTWLIWVTLQTIALIAQFSAGARSSLFFTIGDLTTSAVVLFLAFFKGETKWHWIDKVALIAAALGLLLWYLFRQPIWALSMTIFVDACGVIPTLRKSFANPESETRITWIVAGIAAIFGAIAVGKLDITLLIYPVYIALANLGVALAIELGKFKQKLAKH